MPDYDGLWLVTDANGRNVAVVEASSESSAEWRLRCLDVWRSDWRVRRPTLEAVAAFVSHLLSGEPRHSVHWMQP
jgi:hypothetical protein